MAESSNYDEFLKNLQEQILQYYTEPVKVKLWSLKDETMNSDIMESIDELTMSLVKKYLITNNKNKSTVFWASLSSLFVETSMSLLFEFIATKDYRNEDILTGEPKIQVPSDSADLTTPGQGLHHIPQDTINSLLLEVNRILRKGGLFLIREHDGLTDLIPVPDLAHSILNATTGVSVADEREEIRAFKVILVWRRIIEPAGSNNTHSYYMGRGDTTIDGMMCFHKDFLLQSSTMLSYQSALDQMETLKSTKLGLTKGQQFFVQQILSEMLSPKINMLIAFQPHLNKAKARKADLDLIPDETFVRAKALINKTKEGKVTPAESMTVDVVRDVQEPFHSNLDEAFEGQAVVVHSRHGVIVQLNKPQAKKEDRLHSGDLQITGTKHGSFITWDRDLVQQSLGLDQEHAQANDEHGHQTNVMINDQDSVAFYVRAPPSPDWAVTADNVKSGTPLSRVRHKSRSNSTESPAVTFYPKLEEKQLEMVVEVTENRSYRLSDYGNHATIMMKEGTVHDNLIFLDEGPMEFLEALLKDVSIKKALSDESLYMLMDKGIAGLEQSLSRVNLVELSETNSDMVWRTLSDLQKDPYTTAISTFSKITDKILFSHAKKEFRPEEEIAEPLQGESVGASLDISQSVHNEHGENSDWKPVTIKSKSCVMSSVQHLQRDPPLCQLDWKLHITSEGMVQEVPELLDKIFKGCIEDSVCGVVWKHLLVYYHWYHPSEVRKTNRKMRVESIIEQTEITSRGCSCTLLAPMCRCSTATCKTAHTGARDMCNKTCMRLAYSCNSGGLNLICSVETFLRVIVSTKRLRETIMLLYEEQAVVHFYSDPDDKEAIGVACACGCACICCNGSVCSKKCQGSPGHNTECRARHDLGISIEVVHFDMRSEICVCLGAMMPLYLPGNIKEVTILHSRKIHQHTPCPDVGCGVNRTSHAVKGDVKRNTKSDNGSHCDPCGNYIENPGVSHDVFRCLDPKGGKMSSLPLVNCHLSRKKEVQEMAVRGSSDEQVSSSHCDGHGSLRIVNRELVSQIKHRNLKIMDLEKRVETLEVSLREKKEQTAAEVLGEFLNIEVMSPEGSSNMETDTVTTYIQDTSSETGSDSIEDEVETPDAEKLKTTSVVVTAAVRKEGLEDGETIRYDVLRTVVLGTNPTVSSS